MPLRRYGQPLLFDRCFAHDPCPAASCLCGTRSPLLRRIEFRILSKDWKATVASFCLCSTTVTFRKKKHSCSLIGWRIRRKMFWRRISACPRALSRAFRKRISGSFKRTYPDLSPLIELPVLGRCLTRSVTGCWRKNRGSFAACSLRRAFLAWSAAMAAMAADLLRPHHVENDTS